MVYYIQLVIWNSFALPKMMRWQGGAFILNITSRNYVGVEDILIWEIFTFWFKQMNLKGNGQIVYLFLELSFLIK